MFPCDWKVLVKVSELLWDEGRGAKELAGLESGMVITLAHAKGLALGSPLTLSFSVSLKIPRVLAAVWLLI